MTTFDGVFFCVRNSSFIRRTDTSQPWHIFNMACISQQPDTLAWVMSLMLMRTNKPNEHQLTIGGRFRCNYRVQLTSHNRGLCGYKTKYEISLHNRLWLSRRQCKNNEPMMKGTSSIRCLRLRRRLECSVVPHLSGWPIRHAISRICLQMNSQTLCKWTET